MGPARTQASPAPAAETPGPPAVANYARVATDARGDLVADGEVNGMAIRFAVDTGATFITLPAREATRLGLDYRSGRKVIMETANGDVPCLSSQARRAVRVGNVALNDVDAVITEGDSLPIAFARHASFLNRTDMKRGGRRP